MKITLANDFGVFEMGGGSHPSARVQEIVGIGLPSKEMQSVTFSGQPGITNTGIRDRERTITIKFDFYGDQKDVEKLLRIVYRETDILISSGGRRRKISGICINPEDVEKIIYHRWYAIALQFVCTSPYFSDFYNTKVTIAQRIDQFPTGQGEMTNEETGETTVKWYIDLSVDAIATKRINTAEITIQGDIPIYPVIRIQNNSVATAGVLADYGIEVVNKTTGCRIFLDYEIAQGEVVTIDLPNRRVVSSKNGNITQHLSDDTILEDFVLELGTNEIEATNENTNEDISVVMEYSNQYAMVVI